MAKVKSWKARIAETIQEMKAIDMAEDENGWPTIHWLMANYMLREFSEYDRFRLLPDYVLKIKNNLYNALCYLQEDLGVRVFWDIPNKSIEFLTIDEEINDARQKNTKRIKTFVRRAVRSGLKQLRSSDPEMLDNLQHTKLALPELE